MLRGILYCFDIISRYFSTLFISILTLLIAINAYFMSYIFLFLIVLSMAYWLFQCITKKMQRKNALIRLGIYCVTLVLFFSYGKFLSQQQKKIRTELVNTIQAYHQKYKIYPSRQFVNAEMRKARKYQMRIHYYIIADKAEERSFDHHISLSYRTMLIGPFDTVWYRGNHQWEVIYD